MRIAPPDLHLDRHARLRELMRARSVEALVVWSGANVAYLTGLFASAGVLVVTPDRLRLIVDGRYVEAASQREADLPGLEVARLATTTSYDEALAVELGGLGETAVGFDPDHFTVRQHADLARRLGGAERLVQAPGLVEQLRVRKDAWEVATLREAAGRLSDAAKHIIPKVLAGATESAVAGAVEQQLRRVGFERPAFDTIVASGPHAARPHHRATERRIEPGDLVVLDFGGILGGYAVDLSRTVVVGPGNPRGRRLIEQVAEAQAAAFGAVAPGEDASAVDAAARGVLDREGLGEAFSHGTGHGLGLEVHERPRVGRAREGQAPERLEPGMVFTLEPGAYLPGMGGARIEDDVLVTEEGGAWLTDAPRVM